MSQPLTFPHSVVTIFVPNPTEVQIEFRLQSVKPSMKVEPIFVKNLYSFTLNIGHQISKFLILLFNRLLDNTDIFSE